MKYHIFLKQDLGIKIVFTVTTVCEFKHFCKRLRVVLMFRLLIIVLLRESYIINKCRSTGYFPS